MSLIQRHLTSETRQLLIQCPAFPYILNRLSVWGGAAAFHMQEVQRAINFGARVVSGARARDHISPALSTLGWRGVDDLVRYRDCVRVFGVLEDPRAPQAIRSLFVARASVSRRTTRSTLAGCWSLPASVSPRRAACSPIERRRPGTGCRPPLPALGRGPSFHGSWRNVLTSSDRHDFYTLCVYRTFIVSAFCVVFLILSVLLTTFIFMHTLIWTKHKSALRICP